MARFLCRVVTMAVAGLIVSGCSKKDEGGGDGGPAMGRVESAFHKASAETGVPARFMMATGYLESRLAPQNATASYVTLGSSKQAVQRGTVMTQTAFGLTYKALGLDPAKDESATLEVQVGAYAKYVAAQLKASGVSLTASPATPDDKFYWIENLSMLHRQGLEQRRNVQILFARELIQVLNAGFLWQDSRSGETLTLDKEATPIDQTKFPANGQSWFSLDERRAELYGISYLPLVTVPSGQFVNKPKRVQIVHCPLTLSACLELQTRTQESDVHLAAHYIVPPLVAQDKASDPELNKVLQVADHSQALTLTDGNGESNPVEDSIVVMLVGNSGRIVGGTRQPADPTWFTDFQLRAMGQIVNDVCTLLAQNDATVNRDKCMRTGGDSGVQFHFQKRSEEYRWGDIADFDATIFGAYLASPGGLGIPTAFETASRPAQSHAGDSLALQLDFDSSARTIELERLARCPDNRVVWQPVRSEQVRSEQQGTYDERLHDSGPNRNGEQFYRARVYGKDGKLGGWAMDHVYLTGFEAEATFASDEACQQTAD